MELPGSPPSRGKQVTHAYSRPTSAKQANQSHVIWFMRVSFSRDFQQPFAATFYFNRVQTTMFELSTILAKSLGVLWQKHAQNYASFSLCAPPLPPYNVDLNALYRCLRCQHCLEGVGYL